MKSASELTDFYYTELYDSLQELEQERNAVRKKVLTLFGILGALSLLIIGAIYNSCHCFNESYIWVGVGATAIGGFGFRWLISGYRSGFKEKIIRPLIEAIEKELHYAPDAAIPQSLFQFSHLFEQRIDRFRGNDLVRGTLDGVSLQFSDIHAEHRSRDSKGREHWSTIFQGLFIVADFNKHFKGRTLILPDLAENLFGSFIGGMLQSRNFTKDQLVRMDDPAFEKAFVVYGTDQIEARYILTHTMMQRLLKLKKDTGSKVYVSFNGEKIMIAIDYDKDLFEPTVFSSLLSIDQAMGYIRTLRSSIGIVEELKLNEKLWSKT
ncbi:MULTISPECIES: DUF3137 domain-containing protein [Sulfurimonas]|uniref:DUF3137 domain-containing protein n=1 Tax=Sulfurimonas diazotrophicus TaxID=3131939 RepID=A0ABZ3HC34_9BACT